VAKAYEVDPALFAALESLPLRSLIAVPFIVRGELTGAMVFGSITEPFNQADLRFAERYAYRVSVMLENARLYKSRKTPFALVTTSSRWPLTSCAPRSRASASSHKSSSRSLRSWLPARWPG